MRGEETGGARANRKCDSEQEVQIAQVNRAQPTYRIADVTNTTPQYFLLIYLPQGTRQMGGGATGGKLLAMIVMRLTKNINLT